MSTHSFGIAWVVELMATMEKIHLIGVVMADCGIGVGLSPLISKSMDQLMHNILGIVARIADV
jgi:Ni,Fe-hydrogenase maturation factor